MKFRHAAFIVVSLSLLWVACQKNTVSKVPFITLKAVVPDSVMRAGRDTPFIEFHLVDGDGDIGVDDNRSSIFLADSRYDSSYTQIYFPAIDGSIEDPKKGLEGDCIFYPSVLPDLRPDSIHQTLGDTFYYKLYITDRAGHHSDTIITHPIIIRP